MNERLRIAEKLRKKEAEIASLEEKVKAARVYVQALKDVLKMMDSVENAEVAPDAVLRRGSAVAAAREAILERGVPVHIADLLTAAGKEQTREARSSLTSSLSAYVRRGEIFTRPAPNTFGLVELNHNEDAPEPSEPPTGFGGESPQPSVLTEPPPNPLGDSDGEIDDEF